MTIGASLFVIAIGAILAFAVRAEPDWLDVQTAGQVLIFIGLVMLGITLFMWARRRRRLAMQADSDDSTVPPAVDRIVDGQVERRPPTGRPHTEPGQRPPTGRS